MSHSDLFKLLSEKKYIVELLDDGSIKVDHSSFLDLATYLISDDKLSFDYLMCITSYDNGDGKNYGCAYNFYSNAHKHYIEIRVEVDSETEIPSVSNIWKTADWHEREAYDMIGIVFEGHPNLKRILLSDDWEGYPLRKNYKEPDYYHGMPVPKDKSYWE